MEIKKASSFLDRFKKIFSSRAATQSMLSETVFECVGIEVPPESFSVKGATVYIKGPPALKSEIVMRKEEILDAFYKKGGQGSVRDLR